MKGKLMRYLIFTIMLLCTSARAADKVDITGLAFEAIAQSPIAQSHFMELYVTENGKKANERFFIGALPRRNEAVEMVYTGDGPNGEMYFQLRARPWWRFW